MAGWSKAAGMGIGFLVGGPAGAFLGYFIGKVVGTGISNPSANSLLTPYYETLKVSPTAKIEGIKQSYRALVKQYHPDLQGRVDEKTATLLRKKMVEINEAYGEIRKVRRF